MNNSISDEIKETLHDLSMSSFPFKRQTAANKIGQFSISNDEIIKSLSTSLALDSDPDVRSAAMQALQSPIHQAFLKDKPDFVQKTMELAIRIKTEKQKRDEEGFITEFTRRRRRERMNIFLFLLFYFLAIWLLILQDANRISVEWISNTTLIIALIVVICLMGWLSWRNWRCPNCSSYLSQPKAKTGVFFSAEPLRCPHCGIRLL